MSDWRRIKLQLETGADSTVGTEFARARRTARAGKVDDAFDLVLDLAMHLINMGRPHDALDVLDQLKQFLDRDEVAPDRWPWLANTEGIAASHTSDRSRSQHAYEAMLELAQTLPDGAVREDIRSTALQNLGILFSDSDPERAQTLLTESASIKNELGDLQSLVDILMTIALLASERGDLEEALAMLNDVVRFGRRVRDSWLLTAAYGNRGFVQVARGDLVAAEADLRRALRNARRHGDQLRVSLALLSMGSLNVDAGRPGRAIRYYRQAVRIASNIGASAQEIRSRRALALVLYHRGRKREARVELDHAIQLANGLDERQIESQVRADLGAMLIQDGALDDGIDALEAALAGLHDSDLEPKLQAMRNLAEGYRLAERRADADAMLEEAFASTPPDDHSGRAEIAEAGMHLWAGAPAHGPRAAGYLRRRREELSRFASKREQAWDTAVGAATLSKAGAPEEAVDFFDAALPGIIALKDQRLQWQVRNDRAVALVDAARYAEALNDLRWCLRLGKRLQDRALQQQAHANIGEASRRAGKLGPAEKHQREALALAQALLDQRATAAELGGLALTLSNRSSWADARDLYERQLELADEFDDGNLRATAIGGLAACEYAEGHPGEAGVLYERAARINGGTDPRHYVEDLAFALLSWAAAGRLRRLNGAAQRLIQAAQRYGLEQVAGAGMADAASTLLREGRRQLAVDLYDGAIRLVSAQVSRLRGQFERRTGLGEGHVDSEALVDDELKAFLLELADALGPVLTALILAAERTLGPEDAAAFYRECSSQVDADVGGLKEILDSFIQAIRAGIADAGALPTGGAGNQPA